MARLGPLIFNIADLPSGGIDVRGEVPFVALGVADDERIAFIEPMRFALHIAPVQSQVLVRGVLDTTVEIPCDRCLEPVRVPLHVEDVCHYLEDIESLSIDLTEELREDMLLALPQVCLCDTDCRGLCPQCGQNLNEHECSCKAAEDDDSPWSGLDALDLPDRI